MPQMPCPLLQSRHEGAHPGRHAVDGAEDAAVPSDGCSQASAERIPWDLTSEGKKSLMPDMKMLLPDTVGRIGSCGTPALDRYRQQGNGQDDYSGSGKEPPVKADAVCESLEPDVKYEP